MNQRHNFRGTETTDAIIKVGEELTGNKSEFINRCIEEYGRSVAQMILTEKNRALHSALRDAGRSRKGRQKAKTPAESDPSPGRLPQ